MEELKAQMDSLRRQNPVQYIRPLSTLDKHNECPHLGFHSLVPRLLMNGLGTRLASKRHES